MKKLAFASLYRRIREILESARAGAARSVNTVQVMANWLIGREIVEENQKGKRRAGYGDALLADLSRRLTGEFGRGFSVRHLEYCRSFYLEYQNLPEGKISNAVRSIFPHRVFSGAPSIPHAVRAESLASKMLIQKRGLTIGHALRGQSWAPGRLHSSLSWTHYRNLLRVERLEARAFYEIEAIRLNWSAREMERQIHSLLYERLALSRDKKGLMKLAVKGQMLSKPADIFKDPVVVEFLGLPESHKLVESDLEQGLISNLQTFLLELGKGFAFMARQERLTLDGDHFYVDLVFYHTVLKCHVLIDLKTGALTHQDLGQMQFYVNYYDRERRSKGDNPTLGLILCADKNEAVVKYTLGDHQKKIFASRYKLHLPSEAELRAELRREVKVLAALPAGSDPS